MKPKQGKQRGQQEGRNQQTTKKQRRKERTKEEKDKQKEATKTNKTKGTAEDLGAKEQASSFIFFAFQRGVESYPGLQP